MSRNGRYESHVVGRLSSIQAWRRKGLTEEEISKNLGIGRSSLTGYKRKHPELVEALKTGKDDSIAQGENSLFKRVNGYDYEEVETTIHRDGKAIVRRTTKHVPPEMKAIIFFLTNRSPDWREWTRHEVTGPEGTPLSSCVHIFLPDNERPVVFNGSPVCIQGETPTPIQTGVETEPQKEVEFREQVSSNAGKE